MSDTPETPVTPEPPKQVVKYNLHEDLEGLGEAAKRRIAEALTNAESKITVQTVGAHWKEIIIFILLFLMWITYARMNAAQAELKTKTETYDRMKKTETIDTTLKSVTDHQENLYPKLDASLAATEAALAQIRQLNATVKLMNQDQARKAAASLNSDETSKNLFNLGYPNKLLKGVNP